MSKSRSGTPDLMATATDDSVPVTRTREIVEAPPGNGFPGPDRIPQGGGGGASTTPDVSNAGGKPAKPSLRDVTLKARPDAELRVLRRMMRLLDEMPTEAAKRRTVMWLANRFDDSL